MKTILFLGCWVIVFLPLKVCYSSDADELEMLKRRLEELEKKQRQQQRVLNEVKTHDALDNVKFSADLRTSCDFVSYTTPQGTSDNGTWSNRLILSMGAKPTSDLSFKGAIVSNKTFGSNNIREYRGAFDNSDWTATVTPDDSILRLREAYFVYYYTFGEKLPVTFSLGRRPTLNGLGANFREDDPEASPLSHIINVEVDGGSLKMDLEGLTGISGMRLKLCAGRAYSNVRARFDLSSTDANKPYSSIESENPDMDLFAFVLDPYDDGVYKFRTLGFWASDVIGVKDENKPTAGFEDVGDHYGFAATGVLYGIDTDWSDFLGDSIFFLSGAISRTDPNNRHGGMLGSKDSETGYSIYLGTQFPCFLTDRGRFGLEYSYGSKYWRSVTYGEDTLIGSKLAARGNTYEFYYTFDVIREHLSFQVRYTYIDYDYTGSDLFFGASGRPVAISEALASGIDPVERSQDLRFYFRYRY